MDPRPRWRIAVDTGGTFTDAVAVAPDGRRLAVKVLSTSALRARVVGSFSLPSEPVRPAIALSGLAEAAPVPPPDGFFRGFMLSVLGGTPGPAVEILDWRATDGVAVLAADPWPGGAPAPGAAVELRAPEEAPVLAARLLTGTPLGRPLPPLSLRLATTRGTNALLERKGAPTALFVTRGFADLPAIGDQRRPDLFALRIVKPAPLHAATVEVKARRAADGSVLVPLTNEELTELELEARRLVEEGLTAAAVSLLHADVAPDDERAIADRLARCGFVHVVAGSDLAAEIGLLARTTTALVDASLGPPVAGYFARVAAALGAPLAVLTSSGGLAPHPGVAAKDTLLSGPAGGVVGAAAAGRRSRLPRVIGFDMGGTSTDVSHFDGTYEVVFEHRVGDAALAAPALAIETVAAGGGSICAFDGAAFTVGPASSGALPGPACYGAGGPLTVTDVDLLAGRLSPERFAVPLDPAAAERALAGLLEQARAAGSVPPDRDSAIDGLLAIADERMAEAIRRVSIRRGYDPAEYALVAFGGAGGQHACAVAGRLGISTVLVPAGAGLLSAHGVAAAAVERWARRQVLRGMEEVGGDVEGWLEALGEAAEEELGRANEPGEGPGVAAGPRAGRATAAGRTARGTADRRGAAGDRPPAAVTRRIVHLCFAGQDAALAIEPAPGEATAEALSRAFLAAYEVRFGYRPEGRAIEVVSLAVAAATASPDPEPSPDSAATAASPAGRRRARLEGAWREVPWFDRETLPPGAAGEGPALVFEAHSATVVPPGWTFRVDGAGALRIDRAPVDEALPEPPSVGPPASFALPGSSLPPSSPAFDPIELELFTHRFEAIAREMGEMLRATAVSTNVRERLDFSCGLLDAAGTLVANAPHIPVHLGALGLCVRRVAAELPLAPGDVVLTNHPAFGGSHLPDVTVVTPIFSGDGPNAPLAGYVASRAHHAELGGTRPGSMPPGARTLAEEGVVIPPFKLIEGGLGRWDDLRERLTAPPYPTRAIAENLADLHAAVAANRRGAAALGVLLAAHGRARVAAAMAALAGRAATLLAAALARRGDGRWSAVERLDDGTPLAVAIEITGDRALIDFTGSGPIHPGNLNAPPAVARSAALYVLRLLVAEPLPLNEGLLAPVDLVLPPGTIVDPLFPDDPARAPAVVGGNVETSQRIVDALLSALGLAAGSQGTMNNVLFGTERFGYYETVCGGAGACADGPGADAVHTHMTNTRATDPEILERRYPVRLERFAIRRGSGGAGRHRGGDGVVRELAFLAPVALSLLTQHRVEAPYGLAGGQPGARGRQRLVRADGTIEVLASVDGRDVASGDRLILETPGGGGWGSA